jgi:hypothetical protein
VLETVDGRTMAVLTPELADRLNLPRQRDIRPQAFRRRLPETSVTLNGADYLFYFAEAGRRSPVREDLALDVRRLMACDEAAFSAFEAASSEQDLDGAFVANWITGRYSAPSRSSIVSSAPPACTPGRMRRSPTPAS